MQVKINANMVDQSTAHVATAIRPVFDALSAGLVGDYGGNMEHLWIDLELIEAHAKTDGKPRHPFRFQKRVSGRSYFGLPSSPGEFNVGHFSVRPDFELMRLLPVDQAIAYAISLIYCETEVLHAKSKKLGGFDADLFRATFHKVCRELGYHCER